LPAHGSADPAIGKAWVIWLITKVHQEESHMAEHSESPRKRVAHRNCGSLRAATVGEPLIVVTCFCEECQRGQDQHSVSARIGANVELSGLATPYVREGQEGRQVTYYFCPKCGSSVYWELDRRPSQIGISGGSFFDLNFPAPIRSVWERSKPNWISIPDTEHFDQNPPPPPRQS
jgi:hypothetical protein